MESSIGHLRNFSKAMSSWPWPWKASPSILLLSALSASLRTSILFSMPERMMVTTRWPMTSISTGITSGIQMNLLFIRPNSRAKQRDHQG